MNFLVPFLVQGLRMPLVSSGQGNNDVLNSLQTKVLLLIY